MNVKQPAMLVILDGWALRTEVHGNAIAQAKKPNFDKLWETYPHAELQAAGGNVGLPEGQMGNSEVGHLNIGAGRIVYQSLSLINKAIEDGEYVSTPNIKELLENTKANNGALHITGLLSDGGVHAHINHLFATIDAAIKMKIDSINLHLITDGRDVAQKSAVKYIEQLQKRIKNFTNVKIATISGRYYAMDRDNRWDRVELAYNAIVSAKADNVFTDPIEYINSQYANDLTDEFVMPAVSKEYSEGIQANDGFFFINFRPDRAIQLSVALTNPEFSGFERGQFVKMNFVSMMKYSDNVIGKIALSLQKLDNTLGEYVANKGLNQMRTAETEKYPHVTFFFDGGIDKQLENCDRYLIDSPKVATYDLKPEMSIYEVTDNLLEQIKKEHYDLIIVNFANPDMVGHSGMLEPTIKAIEAVDECLGKVYSEFVEKHNGRMIITADHGNADEVTTDDELPMTAHTTRNVPFIVTDKLLQLNSIGRLADISPTLLDLLDLAKPEEMTGTSMIKK
jgi:2,3-bisphosphoglycerate-independent phosphoglycerate mutase